MKDYPFISCLNPIKITNPYNKERLIVPCGKCKACLMQKSSMLSLKCKLESLSHKYCMFVTLTYSNDYIPLCRPYHYTEKIGGNIPFIKDMDKSQSIFINTCPRVGSDDLIIATTDTSAMDLCNLSNKVNLDGFFPFLYKKDIQDFLKRLRSNLNYSLKKHYQHDTISKTQQTPEQIRYFCSGEYGPLHFRPHYHLLLWFDKPETLALIGQNIHKSWPFGRIDYSLSRGQASSYTAGYVNSNCQLPKIFKSPQTKPFCCHSIRLGEKIFEDTKEKVYKQAPSLFAKRNISLDGVVTDVHLWRSLTFRYYPQCTDYSSKSSSERLYSYKIYATASRWTKENRPCVIARQITDYVFTNGFYSPYPITEFDDEVNTFLDYLRIRCSKYDNLSIMDINNKDQYDYYFRVIYNEIRISHHFLLNCCSETRTPYRMYLMIKEFYDTLNIQYLNKQYSLQEQWFTEESDNYLFMYNNSVVDMKAFYTVPLYKYYCSVTEDKYNNSIKHKKLNDANGIFNNK